MAEDYEKQETDNDGDKEIRMFKRGAMACSGIKRKDGNISTSGDDQECLRRLKKELLD